MISSTLDWRRPFRCCGAAKAPASSASAINGRWSGARSGNQDIVECSVSVDVAERQVRLEGPTKTEPANRFWTKQFKHSMSCKAIFSHASLQDQGSSGVWPSRKQRQRQGCTQYGKLVAVLPAGTPIAGRCSYLGGGTVLPGRGGRGGLGESSQSCRGGDLLCEACLEGHVLATVAPNAAAVLLPGTRISSGKLFPGKRRIIFS